MKCSMNSQHIYQDHLTACPWCKRESQLNGADPFPSPQAVQSGAHLTSQPIPQPPTAPTAVVAHSQQLPQPPQAPVRAQPVLVGVSPAMARYPILIFVFGWWQSVSQWWQSLGLMDALSSSALGAMMGAVMGMVMGGPEYPGWMPGMLIGAAAACALDRQESVWTQIAQRGAVAAPAAGVAWAVMMVIVVYQRALPREGFFVAAGASVLGAFVGAIGGLLIGAIIGAAAAGAGYGFLGFSRRVRVVLLVVLGAASWLGIKELAPLPKAAARGLTAPRALAPRPVTPRR